MQVRQLESEEICKVLDNNTGLDLLSSLCGVEGGEFPKSWVIKGPCSVVVCFVSKSQA